MAGHKLGKLKKVFKGKIFNVFHRDVTLANGKKLVYEYCERPPSVSVLAFNERKQLLLIHEYRHGYKKNVWFLPGGRMDKKGDTPRKAAQRELREETGFRAKKLKKVSKKSPRNTLIWDIYVYAAKDLVPDPLPSDPGEDIRVEFVPFKKAVQMALDGTIENEFISYYIIRFNQMLKSGEFKW